VLVVVMIAVAAGVGIVHARQSDDDPYARRTCLLGSDELRTATAQTLAGLDAGMFSSFRVLEPPPPPLSSDHYRGPLWVWATIAGARDRRTHDMTGNWEVALATGAIAERCSLGLAELSKAMAGGSVRFAGGRYEWASGGGSSPPGRVFGAEASGESDAEIVAQAERTLGDFGLSPRVVRVLHPFGPALLVQATTEDVSRVSGRIPEIERALDGGHVNHPRFEGLYLALDGPDGPLVRTGGAARAGGGFGWSSRGFETGIQHG
jgi:hypothetical protein